MATDPKTDPTFLGRIEYPEYNCYVIRKKAFDEEKIWLDQRLYRLDNDEEVGYQRMDFDQSNLTAEGILDNLLWKIDEAASKQRYQDKQQMYFSGPYQEFSLEEKMEFWLSRAHFYKRVGFEESEDSPAIIVLNKGWLDLQKHYHSNGELDAIVAYMIERCGLEAEIAMEMLKHNINSKEWAEWNQKQKQFTRGN